MISTRCYDGDSSVPLKMWYDIFSQALSPEDESPWGQPLQAAFSPQVPHAGNDMTHILQALLNAAKRHRLLITVDDLQWADGASTALLHHLATLDRGRTILFVLTCRTPTPELETFIRTLRLAGLLAELSLHPFTYPQTKALAESFLPEQHVNDSLAQRLFRESDGNPLFLTECLNNIRFGASANELTPKLIDIIQQRVEALTPDCAKVLETLSVAPEGMEFDLLKELLRWDDYKLAERLEPLLARQFIREETADDELVLHFCHQKILEYMYNRISNARRRVLHGAVAACLEQRPAGGSTNLHGLSRLIFHFERSGQVLKFLEYTIHNIEGYLRLSLEFFPIVREEAPPLILQGEREYAVLSQSDLQNYLENVEHKLNLHSYLLETPEGQQAAARFYYLRALHYTYQVEYELAFRYAQRALQLNTPADCEEKLSMLLDIHFLLTSLYMDCYDLYGLERTIETVWPLLSELGRPETMAVWLRLRGMYCVMVGSPQDACIFLGQAVRQFASFRDRAYDYSLGACWAWMGEALCQRGLLDQAEEAYKKALSHCGANQPSGGSAVFYLFYARFLLDWHPGERDKEAESMLARARKLYGRSGFFWYRSIMLAYSARLSCDEGNYEQGLIYLKEALQSAQKLRSPYELCIVHQVSMDIRRKFSLDQTLEATLSSFLKDVEAAYRKKGLTALNGIED